MRGRALAVVIVALSTGLGACTTTGSSSSSSSDEGKTVDLLHDAGAAQRAITAIVRKVGADPAQVRSVGIYDEYMIVEVQDPKIPEHLDSYTWRDTDGVETPTPVHLSGSQEEVQAALYPTSAVRWTDIPRIARAAERALRHARPNPVEQPNVDSIYVERSSSRDGRVTLRIDIEGPRRSGSVEATTSGEILEQTVD